MATASIDAHKTMLFKVDPYDINWGYRLRTQSTDTYGGKVVQLLGVELTSLTVSTVAGKAGYAYIKEMMKFFRDLGLWQQEYAEPATFRYPTKGYIVKFWAENFSYDNSLDNVVYPVQFSGSVQEDLGGNIKKGIMTKEIKKIQQGIGYVKNKYNDPTISQPNVDQRKSVETQAAAAGGSGGGGASTAGGGSSSISIPNDKKAESVINRALSQLGVTYAWGGGDEKGPTKGIPGGGPQADAAGDTNKIGFDCSGLFLYAYAAIGVTGIPHQTQAIWAKYPHIGRDQLLPGDGLLYSSNGQADGIHHIGLYMGDDQMVEAPQSGDVVKVSSGIWTGSRGSEFIGGVRPS